MGLVKNAVLALILYTLILGSAALASSSQYLCDNILLKEGSLSLNKNEKILVCGVQKNKGPWSDIPIEQAKYQLTVFLNNEGYLEPKFETHGNELHVWSGKKITIKTLQIDGTTALNPSKKRKIIGHPLIPTKLDELEQWGDTQLRMMGYACPQVKVLAEAWTGLLKMNVQTGSKSRVAHITYEGLEEINPKTLSRYEAFKVGDLYDVRKTQISITRMLSDGAIQSGNYHVDCKQQDAVDLALKGSIGPPRSLRFEVGASTEEFPFGSFTFRNSRLDNSISSLTSILYASPRTQSLTTTAQLYWIPWSERMFLSPRLRFARNSEQTYEFLEARTGLDLGVMWDTTNTRWIARGGPSLNYVNTVQGIGPDDEVYFSWDAFLQMTSHNYEASLRNQYEGWDASLHYRGQKEGLGSKVDVNRYDLNYKYLWNMGRYHPPLFVLGVRTEINIVDTPNLEANNNTADVLPIDYRIFYGGADNLRGFARKSLTNSDLGYLAAAYIGFELRLVEQVPMNIQPLLLVDVARLGVERLQLDDPIFSSLGAGVRWASPFGTLRGSAAKGRIFNGNTTTLPYNQDWVYFISFGQEF